MKVLLSGRSIALLLLPLLTGVASAETAAFRAVKTSFVQSNLPSYNYGAKDSLEILAGQRYGFAQWDLSSIPSSAVVTAASVTFRVRYIQQTGTGSLSLLQLTGPWVQGNSNGPSDGFPAGELTWNNKPAVSLTPLATATYNSSTPGNCTFADAALTQLVQDWISGAISNYGLQLRNSAAIVVGLYSMNNSGAAAEYIPVLSVTYQTGVEPPPKARLQPAARCIFGAYVGYEAGDTAIKMNQRLGFNVAALNHFTSWPLPESKFTYYYNEANPAGAIAIITIMPSTLALSAADCEAFATLCQKYEALGLKIMVRFAHEMNGSWFSYGRQPLPYKAAFQMLADAVHSRTEKTAMVWCPNVDANATFDHNPYEAYYPGNQYVDWVGIDLYHQNANSLAYAKEYAKPIQIFYQLYARRHGKPMGVFETAADYAPSLGGPAEHDVKSAWWEQVYNITASDGSSYDVAQNFPLLKLVAWFETSKQEGGSLKDWRATVSDAIRPDYISYVRKLRSGKTYFMSAAEYNSQPTGVAVTPNALIYPGNTIALRQKSNGQYISAASSTSSLIANAASTANLNTRFQIVDAGNGLIALKSVALNTYVNAPNATSPLVANSTTIGASNEFIWGTMADGNIALKARSVLDQLNPASAVSGSTGALIPNKEAVGTAETFIPVQQ